MRMHHIIIADDEAAIRFLLGRFILRQLPSATITEVPDASEALRVYDERGADALIVDYKLRGMSGIDLIRVLRDRDIKIPIILLSGDHLAREDALDAGATRFQYKSDPIDVLVDELIALLQL